MNSAYIASPQTLARRIRSVREARSLSQGEVGAQAGVDQSYISRLERGDIESPGLLQVGAISYALGFDIWILAGRDDEAFQRELACVEAEAAPEIPRPETLADLAGPSGAALGNLVEMGVNVLIVGPTGSGKTRVARAVTRRMPGRTSFISTDGDTREGLPSIVGGIGQEHVNGVTRSSARDLDGLVVDSLPSGRLTEFLEAATGIEQLVCVCGLPKRKGARIPTDKELLQSVAHRLHTDGRGIAEVFDYLVRTDRIEDGDFSVKVLELGLQPALSPVLGR